MPPRSKSTTQPSQKKPRRRRDAAEARAAILHAAARRLVQSGPGGLRLQEVAADAGVSHPTVLHHFGSREALVRAVITRSIDATNARLVEAIAASSGEERDLAAMLDGVYAAMASSGHARVLLWLALEGHGVEPPAGGLGDVVDAAQALRTARLRANGERAATREDTAFVVVLASLALTAAPVIGPALLRNAGVAHDAAGAARFRGWLARLLSDHLDRRR